MDIGVMGQRDLPHEVGHKLVEIADGVLAENLGRAPETRELAELAETMVSELLSGMYCAMRDREGSKEAQEWLRKALAMAAAAVRMRGSDALIKIDVSIRDVPNTIVGRPPAAKPPEILNAPEPMEAPCACKKDAEGRCPECAPKLAGTFQQFFGAFRDMARFRDAFRDVCVACRRDQMDYAVSTAVPSIFEAGDRVAGEKTGGFAQETLGLLYQMSLAMGVKDMPLTIEAWRKEAGARGAVPEGA